MTQALTRAHVENFRQARLTRDPRLIEPFIDDNVDWLVTGPVELLHFCGQRRGKAEVLDCITRLEPSALNVLKAELTALLVDRDRAASFGRMVAVQPATGRTITYHQAQFMRFRGGKIIEYRAIIDSFDAAEQMMGHPIALPDMPRAMDIGGRIVL
jgi:ketosteroid isomerase-like protein